MSLVSNLEMVFSSLGLQAAPLRVLVAYDLVYPWRVPCLLNQHKKQYRISGL